MNGDEAKPNITLEKSALSRCIALFRYYLQRRKEVIMKQTICFSTNEGFKSEVFFIPMVNNRLNWMI